MKLSQALFSAAEWETRGLVTTKHGPRFLLICREPTEQFWSLYRQYKDNSRKLGVSPKKESRGWEIMWWAKDIPEAYEESPEAARESKSIDASRLKASPLSSNFTFPLTEGAIPYPFQRAGVEFLTNHDNSLMLSSMGTGKTCQVIWACNYLKPKRILVICPASLCLNWKKEIRRFSTLPSSVAIAGESCWEFAEIVLISADSAWRNRYAAKLREVEWDLMVVDEAHMLGNPDSERTRGVFGGRKGKGAGAIMIYPIPRKRIWLLTGTPMNSKPQQFWPLLHALWPKEFKSLYSFENRYCGAYIDGFGRRQLGDPQNLDELHSRIYFLGAIRHLLTEVMPQMPTKSQQILELPHPKGMTRIKALEGEIELSDDAVRELAARRHEAEEAGTYEDFTALGERIKSEKFEKNAAVATYRRELGEMKVPLILEHCRSVLESEQKLVVMVHHRSVQEQVATGLKAYGVIRITGEQSQKARFNAVESFQSNPKVRVAVCSIKASGLGITLTAARWMVFGEIDWVPSALAQASDRVHRIGQEEHVQIQYLLIENTIEALMMKKCIMRQLIHGRIIDGSKVDTAVNRTRIHENGSNGSSAVATRREPENPAAVDPEPQKLKGWEGQRALTRAMRILAGMDKIGQIDGQGFSHWDSRLGRDLAKLDNLNRLQSTLAFRLALKYRKQLPPELMDEIEALRLEQSPRNEDSIQPVTRQKMLI